MTALLGLGIIPPRAPWARGPAGYALAGSTPRPRAAIAMLSEMRLWLRTALVGGALLGAPTSAARCDDRTPSATAEQLIGRFESDDFGGDPDLHPGPDDGEFLARDAADFDSWQPLLDDDGQCATWEPELWRPMDRLRQLGFRHSSSEGRHMGHGLPLERSSWMNRPFHVDWFAGPVLGDDLVADAVGQSNDVLAGLRLGWDVDYFWGLDWRFGWSSPGLDQTITSDSIEGRYFVSDIDVVYYPWGDSKFRPYFLAGLGLAQVETVRANGLTDDVTLLGMPFGAGVRFLQTPWLAWRLEVLDNLALGNEGVRTLNNFSFTAGMEFRLGARPNSYWPWRSSRRTW